MHGLRNGKKTGRIDKVTQIVLAIFGGIEYLTEETNPPAGKTPRIGKQFWDREGTKQDCGIVKIA